jgi:hypothetical protein
MYSCAAASLAAFLCPQDFLFVLILRGALKDDLWIESAWKKTARERELRLFSNASPAIRVGA